MGVSERMIEKLLAGGPFRRESAPYRLIQLTGADAGDFLQRLCSQDVLALADGGLLPAAFLDAKGKLLATCLVGRLTGDFWLEVQQEQEERLAALLDRYLFSERVRIVRHGGLPVAELIGAGAGASGVRALGRPGEFGLLFDHRRRGVQFQRGYGDAARAVEVTAAEPLDPTLAECLRMACGLVRPLIETEANTLALEAGLDDHCSTTKGCYTGQEIVARIHTYGHVNRRLCLLQLERGEPITAAVPLLEPDGTAVGRVVHALPVPGLEARLGLGYLPQDFQAEGTALRAGQTAVTVLGAL